MVSSALTSWIIERRQRHQPRDRGRQTACQAVRRKKKDLRLVSKPNKYAHIDPLTATPKKNAFLKNLVKFLKKQVG